MQILRYIIVLAASAAAAVSDYKYYKIKNNITVSTAIAGFLLAFADKNFSIKSSAAGFLLPFAVCLVLYLAKMLKAGDVKLFMCIGAVMGYKWIVNCMAASMLAGGVLCAVVFIKRKCLKRRFKKLFDYFKGMFYAKMLMPYAQANDDEAKFPFGVCIFVGTAVTVVLDVLGVGLFFTL